MPIQHVQCFILSTHVTDPVMRDWTSIIRADTPDPIDGRLPQRAWNRGMKNTLKSGTLFGNVYLMRCVIISVAPL